MEKLESRIFYKCSYILRSASPKTQNDLFKSTVRQRFLIKQRRESVLWALVSIFLLCIVAFDVYHTCPFTFSKIYYIEYTFAVILFLSFIYNALRYIYYMCTIKTIRGDFEQRVLLGFTESDSSFVTQATKESTNKESEDINITSNKFEVSQTWHSFNDSRNSPWLQKSSPNRSPSNISYRSSPQNDTPVKSYSPSKKNYSFNDLIEDEKDLKDYLK